MTVMVHNNALQKDSGISESIGFVLIFSLVIVGISLVSLYGYPMLLKQQASADQKIMEKNMIVLQNDLKSLCYKSVPFKETSLKIGGGSLGVVNESASAAAGESFNISVNGVPVNTFLPGGIFNPGQLRYESNDVGQVVAIDNGAVVYRQFEFEAAGSTMLAQPQWFFDTDPVSLKRTTVIYLIGINSTQPMGSTGVGTVQMQLVPIQPDYYYNDGSPGTLRVEIDYIPDPKFDYSVAWKNYITKFGPPVSNPSTNVYKFDTDILVIKRYDALIRSV